MNQIRGSKNVTGGDYESSDYIGYLHLYNALIRPSCESALTAIDIPKGARILDAGCGAGDMLCLISDVLGKDCEITGIDNSDNMLAGARETLESRNAERIELIKADLLDRLPLDDSLFDCVWICDVLHPSSGFDHTSALLELKRVLKPGGTLAVFHTSWLRPIYLPGYSFLEHMLARVREHMYSREEQEESAHWEGQNHPERAMGWLMDIGLTDCTVSIHTSHHVQPLQPDIRRFLEIRLESVYQKAVRKYGKAAGMTRKDMQLWNDISDPLSGEFILDQHDYYFAVFALLAQGRKC